MISAGRLLPDEQHLTKFGSFLRSTSMDELPQLWNVLRGDLSLVGPRPLLMQYLDRYTPAQARRNDVLHYWLVPGQRPQRTSVGREIRAGHVVRRRTGELALDLKILFQTALSVIRRDGIFSEGHVTMPEFMGRRFGEHAAGDESARPPVLIVNRT